MGDKIVTPAKAKPSSIAGPLLENLADPRARFVFPSEVAARSWLERALDLSGRKALPSARFVSWDGFKAERFPGPEDRQACPRLVRSLFARALMEENAKAPFLDAVVPAAAAEHSARFARMVSQALPGLRALPGSGGPYIRDWKRIKDRYETFLAERSLYEPAWHPRAAEGGSDSWLLFYPDLTEDWLDYKDAVLAMPDARVVDASSLPVGRVEAASFDTLVDEVRAAILLLLGEAKKGTALADMAISVAAPDAALPVLTREAAVAGLPLELRDAQPLSDSSGGRLLSDLLAIESTGRSFAAVRRLLLDVSRPWKDPASARALVDFGIRRHVVAPLPEHERDLWEASMDASLDEGAKALYRGLSRSARAVAKASGFKELRQAFDAFRDRWMDESRYERLQDDELARCVAELEALAEAAHLAGMDSCESAAQLWLEHLEGTPYLPDSPGGGVSVYRFPVAAGAYPALHLCINLAEGAAASASRPLSFLRDDERALAGAIDRDLSPGLVRLLAQSGSRVVLSWSEDGPEGVRPHHPALKPVPPETLGLAFPRSAWLLNRDEPSETLIAADGLEAFPLQLENARSALASRPGAADLSARYPDDPAVLKPGLAAFVAASRCDKDGRLSLTDTMMEAYLSCSFRWLFSSVLEVRARDSGLSFVDARMVGTVYHDALAGLFGPMARDKATARAGPGQGMAPDPERVPLALDQAIARLASREGPFAGALLRSMRPFMLASLSGALRSLLEILNGKTVAMVEQSLSCPAPGTGSAMLTGKADLVASDGEGEATIIDYKKHNLPDASELVPDEEGTLQRLQMPVYRLLVGEAGLRAEEAWYQAVERKDKKGWPALHAIGKSRAVVGPDKLESVMRSLGLACERVALGVRSGWVSVPPRDRQGNVCKDCTLRPLCRIRYAVA